MTYRDRSLGLLLRLLTGMRIQTEEECLQAIDILHQKGAKVVVLTSCTLADDQDRISVYGSSNINGKSRRFRAAIKRLPVWLAVALV